MKYKVNWDLDLGTKQHKKDDEIDMKEKDAEQLVASGVLSLVGKPGKGAAPAPGGSGGAGATEGEGGTGDPADDNAGSGAPQ